MNLKCRSKSCDSTDFKLIETHFITGAIHIERRCIPNMHFNGYAPQKKNITAQYKLGFGKHEGKTLQWIVDNDRAYAFWLRDEKDGKPIGDQLTILLGE